MEPARLVQLPSPAARPAASVIVSGDRLIVEHLNPSALELLARQGATVSYTDPYVASLAHGAETLRSVLPLVDAPTGRTYRLLRETRMAAVMCELFSRDEPTGASLLASSGPAIAQALAAGVRKGIEDPIEVA